MSEERPPEATNREKTFWLGQNIFVVMAGGGVVIVPEHVVWGAICIVAGIVGFIYSWLMPVSSNRPAVLWVCALAITWLALATDYYDRHHGLSGVIMRPLVKGWGAPAGAKQCAELFDGSALLEWSDKYSVAFACGLVDPTVDKFEDDSITVTPVFSIHPGEISILVPFSKPMSDKMDSIIVEARASMPKTTPKGVPVAVAEQIWYEPILLPKTAKSSDIHRLSDVPRNGGAVLSQGLPRDP